MEIGREACKEVLGRGRPSRARARLSGVARALDSTPQPYPKTVRKKTRTEAGMKSLCSLFISTILTSLGRVANTTFCDT